MIDSTLTALRATSALPAPLANEAVDRAPGP